MSENEISIEELVSSAFRKRLKSHLLGIIVSVGIIIVTAVLVCYYPKFECNKRLLFLVSSVWPSGVIMVLVPIWTELVRDLRENIGYDIYRLLRERVSGSPEESYFLMCIDAHSKELMSTDKMTRRRALEEIVEEINGGHRSQ